MRDWLVSEIRDVFAPSPSARFALDLSDRRVTLLERTLGGGRRVRGVARNSSADFAERLAGLKRLVARRKGQPARVDLLLPQELTLFRIETFPAEATKDLRREAWRRLETWAPYRAEELCYDVAVLEIDPRSGFLTASAAVAPREIVDEAVRRAVSWGFRPRRVSMATPVEGFPSGPTFLETASELETTRTLRRQLAALVILALCFTAVGAVRGVLARQGAAAAAETRLAQTREALAEVAGERAATIALAAAAERPAQTRRIRFLASERLRALSAALPQEAVIEQVLLDGGAARVDLSAAGDAGALAAAAARALSATGIFEQAQGGAGPTRDAAERTRGWIEATASRRENAR